MRFSRCFSLGQLRNIVLYEKVFSTGILLFRIRPGSSDTGEHNIMSCVLKFIVVFPLLGKLYFVAASTLDFENPIDHPLSIRPVSGPTSYCQAFGTCKLTDTLKSLIRRISELLFHDAEPIQTESSAMQEKNYYQNSGLSSNPFSSKFHPTLDPLSLLASFAFLAFLLQSIAPLFNGSRSNKIDGTTLTIGDGVGRIVRYEDSYENESLLRSIEKHS